MPISIAIQFPAGRFHATPWGHHVNEGVPEWPPSPWRLSRAIIATWKRKLTGDPLVESELPGVIAALSPRLPSLYLPPATLGHTRHYMPLRFPDQGDRTKVFDAFVSLDPDAEVVFHWPGANLSADGFQALGLVLSQLGYFGRAESWAIARLLPDFEAERVNCSPGPPLSRDGWETVRVLVADPETWNTWDYTDKKVIMPDPRWNVLAETADMHREKWSDPPGSRWVSYSRRSDCFQIEPRIRSQRQARVMKNHPSVARFVIDAPVLPLVQDTLPLAEQLRRAMMSTYQCLKRRQQYGSAIPPQAQAYNAPVFSGKDSTREPLRDDHRHAFYLPTDEDGDGRIDHLTVFARGGFGERDPIELHAIDKLRRLKFAECELSLMLVGLGRPEDFATARLLGPSMVWESATPFVVTRHLKLRGLKRDPREWCQGLEGQAAFVEQVLREELERRGFTGLVIERLKGFGPRRLQALQFRLNRRKPGDNGGQRPRGAFRIRFSTPVCGPIAIGHSCHFGLGLFLPSSPRSDGPH